MVLASAGQCTSCDSALTAALRAASAPASHKLVEDTVRSCELQRAISRHTVSPWVLLQCAGCCFATVNHPATLKGGCCRLCGHVPHPYLHASRRRDLCSQDVCMLTPHGPGRRIIGMNRPCRICLTCHKQHSVIIAMVADMLSLKQLRSDLVGAHPCCCLPGICTAC